MVEYYSVEVQGSLFTFNTTLLFEVSCVFITLVKGGVDSDFTFFILNSV